VSDQEHKDYFPGASHTGKLFNINGVIWLIRKPTIILNEEGQEEIGWDGNDMSKNAAYHFFTESELKEKNFVIQEF
jgi:hypothetical protein